LWKKEVIRSSLKK